MAKSSHAYPWNLPSKTVVAGQNDIIEGKLLPKMLFGAIAHTSKFNITVEFTPTFTTAPTVFGNNQVYTRFDFFDGTVNRFTGGLNALRTSERIMKPMGMNPDTDANTASASQRTLRRTLDMGPVNYAGNPSDFLMPNGALDNAELRLQCGQLTDISADTTVLTGTTRVEAEQVLLPAEVRIPPVYERKTLSATGGDAQLQGQALYDYIAVASATFAAMSAGDIGTVNLDLGDGLVVPGVNARDLTNMFLSDKQVGDFSLVMGEPSAAADISVKQVNRATPTAVTSTPADLQVVIWSGNDALLNKRPLAKTSAHLFWSGAQTARTVHTGKFLPQLKPAVGAMIAKAFAKLPFQPKNARLKSLSKDAVNSPFAPYFPWVVDV